MTATSSVPFGAAVPSLVRWGVTSDADLVFRTLATFGPRPVRDLATELGLPRQRVDNALAELRECGAATAVADARRSTRRTPVWVGRPAADVVTALRERRARAARPALPVAAHRNVVQALNERLGAAGLSTLPTSLGGTIGDGVRYLPTRDLSRRRLAELTRIERLENLAINTEQAFDAASARAGAPLSHFLAERGVRVRVLGRPPADGDTLDATGHLVNGRSYQYRESPQTPLKLVVLGRRVAFFPVNPDDFERGYLEVSQPAVVSALVALFERHWASAMDPRVTGLPAIVLSEREQALVALLAEGHTDVTAAERLRISARSVTNVLRALMDRIGVDNRFQLGLALGALRVAAPPSLDGRPG